MSVTDAIKTKINDFCSAVRGSEDGRDPRVSGPLESCEEASATWAAVGEQVPLSAYAKEQTKMAHVEPVLQAAYGLMDALHEVNPEGLPSSYREFAHSTQKLLDLAESRHFRVRDVAGPKP